MAPSLYFPISAEFHARRLPHCAFRMPLTRHRKHPLSGLAAFLLTLFCVAWLFRPYPVPDPRLVAPKITALKEPFQRLGVIPGNTVDVPGATVEVDLVDDNGITDVVCDFRQPSRSTSRLSPSRVFSLRPRTARHPGRRGKHWCECLAGIDTKMPTLTRFLRRSRTARLIAFDTSFINGMATTNHDEASMLQRTPHPSSHTSARYTIPAQELAGDACSMRLGRR